MEGDASQLGAPHHTFASSAGNAVAPHGQTADAARHGGSAVIVTAQARDDGDEWAETNARAARGRFRNVSRCARARSTTPQRPSAPRRGHGSRSPRRPLRARPATTHSPLRTRTARAPAGRRHSAIGSKAHDLDAGESLIQLPDGAMTLQQRMQLSPR